MHWTGASLGRQPRPWPAIAGLERAGREAVRAEAGLAAGPGTSGLQDWLGQRLDRLVAGGAQPDTEHDRLRKTTTILLAMLSGGAALGGAAALLGAGMASLAAVPLGYALIVGAGLALAIRDQRFLPLQASLLGLLLVLPFCLQGLLGWQAGNPLFLWALLSPVGALLFARPLAAVWLFGGFLFLAGATLAASAAPPVLLAAALAVALFLPLRYFLYHRERSLATLEDLVRRLLFDQARTEQLLLNLLPQSIAVRLRTSPGTIAEAYDEATILFADIVDFSRLSADIGPRELVELLNGIFSAFDQLAEEHGLEKIKTIGDAYMVAGGLPYPRADHAEAVADMALGMLDIVSKCRVTGGNRLAIRLGIHTGPVVAGVIGRKKLLYDLWGEAVNTASRMESQGVEGIIQVSEDAYLRLRNQFDFEERGAIYVKGKGKMTTYLLHGRKAAA